MSSVAHYCQKCLAANPLGQEMCGRCGTRLMIIVAPPAARYESSETGPSNEEHLLERISALENRLARMSEKLDRGLELLLRQAQNSHFDRALLKTLVGLLTDDGVIQSARLEKVWVDRCQKDAEQQQEDERRTQLRLRILSAYRGPEQTTFESSVNEGFLFLDDGQLARGIKCLKRAAEISPDNDSLLSFIGEHFFRTGKPRRALSYLSRAHELSPQDRRTSLLLGLAYADDGDTQHARELLNAAMRLGGPSFAAHYGLGRLFVAEENWSEALKEFKLALAVKDSPEAHYTLGCVYYQLSRDALAARHLRKALEMDTGYSEACFLLGMISERAGQKKAAQKYFERAKACATADPPSLRKPNGKALAEALGHANGSARKRLVTGGSRRLAEALRADALKT
jgi:Flp pilus assembly protein TadD